MLPQFNDLLNSLFTIAASTSEAIVNIYQRSCPINVINKVDNTPVTEADYAAHLLITERLQGLTPQLPILSEEGNSIDFSQRQTWQDYWLIDPLDGTQEFINRSGEFTINIALIHEHKPVLGIVYQPTTHDCYYAVKGQGAYLKTLAETKRLKVRKKPSTPIIAISHRHNPLKLKAILANFNDYGLLNLGSALKICKIAEGEADVYPRLGPTSEWDTAAGQCILEEAGGQLINLQGQPLMYNTKDSLINPKFLAIGDEHYDWLSHLITTGAIHE